MIEIISVRFKEGGKQYYFNPDGKKFQEGDGVIVETARGTEYGLCVQGNTAIDEIELTAPLRPVVRMATEEDREIVERNREKEKRAFEICQEKILAHGLDMKLVDAEYSFEGNKALFFFTSEGRVDFRALVKDLASTLHARIELRQIGVRDEAKMLGGLGICGRPFCCAQFLDEFQPVSIKMAKTQNLSLNPTKISGACGRLMCCLKYEQDAYEDLVKHSPKAESFVETPDGAGVVTNVNLLRQTVQVRLESAPESPKDYHNSELHIIRNGKGKRPEDYVEPPLEELAKLRREEEAPKPTPEEELSEALEAALGGPESWQEEPPQLEKSARAENPRPNRSRSSRRRSGGEAGAERAEEKSRERTGESSRRPNFHKGPQAQGERSESAGAEGTEHRPNRRENGEYRPRRRRRPPHGSRPNPDQGKPPAPDGGGNPGNKTEG